MSILTLQRTLDADQVEPLAGPLFARYQTARVPPPEGTARVCFMQCEVSAPNPADVLALPNPRHPDFLRAAAKVSTNIQSALRAWLPLLWFADLSRFDDFDSACALLIYASCRTFTARDRTAYTFDVLDSDTPRAVLYSDTRSLPERLPAIHRMLAAMGHPKANQYKTHHLDRILGSYQRKPHPLHSIFVAERDLIEAYVTRGEWDASPKRRSEAEAAIARRFRRLLFGQDFSELMPVFECESQLMPLALTVNFPAKFDAQPAPFPHEDDSPNSGDPASHASGGE